MNTEPYDIIIAGAGPAGLTAAIYAARYKLNCIVIGQQLGGWASDAPDVKNYPGFAEITGLELSNKIGDQVKALGVDIKPEEIKRVEKEGELFKIRTPNGEYLGKKVIFSLGTIKRKIGVTGEDAYLGKGLSYCATCDGPLFGGKKVAVVGGGNSALTSALLLAKYAEKVYLIYRKDGFFRADESWVEQAKNNEKIEFIFNSMVEKLEGDPFLNKITLNGGKEMEIEGLFIEIGSVPGSELLGNLGVAVDEKNYIKVDKYQKTNVQGVFAAGDITNNPLKQIVTAASQGATAAYSAHKELSKEK